MDRLLPPSCSPSSAQGTALRDSRALRVRVAAQHAGDAGLVAPPPSTLILKLIGSPWRTLQRST